MSEDQRRMLRILADQGDVSAFRARLEERKTERTEIIDVVIPGDPVAKARPRATIRGGRPVLYTPKKTAEWAKEAGALMAAAYEGPKGLEDPIAVWVDAVKRRPKNRFRKKDPDVRTWRTKMPDGDNVMKAVLDALEKSGVIDNDKQVVETFCRSYYTSKAEEPGVRVRVYLLDGEVL